MTWRLTLPRYGEPRALYELRGTIESLTGESERLENLAIASFWHGTRRRHANNAAALRVHRNDLQVVYDILVEEHYARERAANAAPDKDQVKACHSREAA